MGRETQLQLQLEGRAKISSQVNTETGFTRTESVDGYDVLVKYRSANGWGAFAPALIDAEHAEQANDILDFFPGKIGGMVFGPLATGLDRVLLSPEYLIVVLRRNAVGPGGCLELAKSWGGPVRDDESTLPVTRVRGIEVRGAVRAGERVLSVLDLSQRLSSLGIWYMRRDPAGVVLFLLPHPKGHDTLRQTGETSASIVGLLAAVDVTAGDERHSL